MIRKKPIFIIMLLSIFYLSCSKKVTETCLAGTGGNVNLIAFPRHHDLALVSMPAYPDTAYLKFNATDFPGSDPSLYDVVYISETGADSISIKGLKCGNYFLYIVAFHNSMHARLRGGAPVSITRSDGEINIVVALAE